MPKHWGYHTISVLSKGDGEGQTTFGVLPLLGWRPFKSTFPNQTITLLVQVGGLQSEMNFRAQDTGTEWFFR